MLKSKIIISLDHYLEEDDGWLLLCRHTLNDRTIIMWYNPEKDQINMSLFHQFEQPNAFSRRAKESQWGYMTYFIEEIKTEDEATEIVNLYLEDIEKENCWWEKDTTH